jgi:trimethylamine:corrinoid methyltransferase-like protein
MLRNRKIEEIHGAALQILSEAGVMFESKDALQILKDNGAEVEGSVVHIPEELTRECLRRASSSISLYGLDGSLRCRLEGDEVFSIRALRQAGI